MPEEYNRDFRKFKVLLESRGLGVIEDQAGQVRVYFYGFQKRDPNLMTLTAVFASRQRFVEFMRRATNPVVINELRRKGEVYKHLDYVLCLSKEQDYTRRKS